MSFFEERAELLKKSTEAAQLKYEKTGGYATGEGDRYEERCLALLFLRGVREGLQFALSAHDAAGGKFHNLVLCWDDREGRGVSALFVQLKHKTSTKQTTVCKSSLMWHKDSSKKDSKDFSIEVCRESYEKMKNYLDGGSYALVLATNLDLDRDAQSMFVKQETGSAPGLQLLDAGGCCYRLNPLDDDAKSAARGDDEFLRHFYVFCNQSNSKTIKSVLYAELKGLLGADASRCAAACKDLCARLRDWMNSQDVCLTGDWKSWRGIVDAYIGNDVTTCNSVVTRTKYECVAPLEAYVHGRNPAWVRPPGQAATSLSATKVHQIICAETHIVVSATRFSELEEKILCCWGPFCRWLVLVDDAEHSYDTLLRMGQLVGPKRRLVIISYKGYDSFLDTCKSGDICEDSWKELIDVTIKLNSEQHVCCLEDLCDATSLKAMLDGKPEALVALSQLSDPVRMGQDLDSLPVKHISRQLTFRMRVREEFFSCLGDKDVCITDEMSYRLLTNSSVVENTVNFEELDNYLSALYVVWPLLVVANNIDRSAVHMICSKHTDILVYVLSYVNDGWEILFLHRGSAKIRPYIEEESRSLLQTVNGLRNEDVVEGKPGVGKSTMLLDMASQLKRQYPSWWILRIDLLKYSKVFDSCHSGVEASKNILFGVVYNEGNLGVLERSLLQHCLLEYPRIICMVDGFDEICPDYGDKCLQALQELAPRRGKLLVTTRPSVTGRLESALGVLAHSLPAFSEDQLRDFHGWSRSETGLTNVVRDLLKIPLLSRMYAESLESGIVVHDIVSLYEAFFERKFRRVFEEKWCDSLSVAGKKEKVERERREHEKQLGFLAMSDLLPNLEVPRPAQFSSTDRDELVKAGIVYQFIDDKPVFVHRTFAEYFLAKLCFYDNTDGLRNRLYCKGLSDSGLEFFVESFDRMASRGRPLLMAVVNGSESEVKSLLEKGADPAEEDVVGRNSLHLVPAYSRDSSLLRLLVERLEMMGVASVPAEVAREAVEVEAVSEVDEAARSVEKGRTAGAGWEAGDSQLADASGTGVVKDAVSVAMGAEDGLLHWTPLRYAAERRRWRAVAALLEMGAKLHHLGDFQRGLHTPEELWRVYKEGGYRALFDHVLGKTESEWSSEVVEQPAENKRCSEMKVGLSIVCTQMTAKQYEEIALEAARNCDTQVAMLVLHKMQFELHRGSSGSGQLDECGQTPLHEAGLGSTLSQQLTRADDVVNRRDEFGETMLHKAAAGEDGRRVRQLIETGADVHARTSHGFTAMHLTGSADCIKWLLRAGAGANVRDETGRTPLHYAALRGVTQGVKLLLAAGADALVEDSRGETSLHAAVAAGNAECVRLLASAAGNLDTADGNGLTALHHAAKNGDVESVKHLLRAGAHSSPANDVLGTPLHLAALAGHAECARLLLQAEADPAARNAAGNTALQFAIASGNTDCVRHLLKAGTDIQQRDQFGNTPLHCAALAGTADCVRLLLEEGADVRERNNDGRTAVQCAALGAKDEIVMLLLDAGADFED